MSSEKLSLWRIYGLATLLTLVILTLVATRSTAADFIKVLILAGLEITFSFDNAIINARILQRMSRFWRSLFLTAGIAIAVFGVRVLLPLVIVSLTAHLSIHKVLVLALHYPANYATQLKNAHPAIATFGGIFLLMIFLDFILTDRPVKWFKCPEKWLAKAGQVKYLSVFMSAAVLAFCAYALASDRHQATVLIAGLTGLIVYLAINVLDRLFSGDEEAVMKIGLVGFLYLELIDASFSLDGVIGAFAITTKVLLIAAGLGIGAFYVRSLTVHLMQRGTLNKFRYLDHGAHYAIGILATLMLLSIRYEVPELVTGLSGVAIISLAVLDSHLENKAQ